MENTIKTFSGSLLYLIICLIFSWPLLSEDACRADWPMWRYGAGRGGVSPDELPETLYLQWERQLPRPAPAWPPEQYKLQFDRSYEPVVAGKTIFLSSMVSDKVTAYDTDTGVEKWRFYCDGPVRFAPVVYKDKLIFASDDGYLYCLNAKTGAFIYKFRAAPADRKILGNGRLINTWPVRGGPVLYDGKVYFTAGIWPFMGIFIYAIDAESGAEIWNNSGSGSIYTLQPHKSPAFAGVAPQGYIAACEDKLVIPGGRSAPSVYDRRSGEFLYFNHNTRRKDGGCAVMISGDYFFNGITDTGWAKGLIHRLSDGYPVFWSSATVVDKDVLFTALPGRLTSHRLPASGQDKKLTLLYDHEVKPAISKVHFQAGSRVYTSAPGGVIAAIEIPDGNDKPQTSWQSRVGGNIWNMLAADDKLFVVTVEGGIYCFGETEIKPKRYRLENQTLQPASLPILKTVEQILQQTSQPQGYCLLFGLDDGELLKEMIRQTKLHIVAFDLDGKKVAILRRELDEAGLYGRRIAIHTGDIFSTELPPYLANLIVVNKLDSAGFRKNSDFTERIFHSLRPYGGVALLRVEGKAQSAFLREVEAANLLDGGIENTSEYVLLKRDGSLPGSADWTHQYGDAAHTVCSKDKLVKAPLGLLWFGDRSEFTDVLPRHGHGPAEHVVGGRLFIEGINSISARDVYTGRILWKRAYEDMGTFGAYYDNTYKPNPRISDNQVHLPGANEVGSNFVSMSDGIYVMLPESCLVLNPATGETINQFSLSGVEGQESVRWGSIAVWDDLLIIAALPIKVPWEDEDNDNKGNVAPEKTKSVSNSGSWLSLKDLYQVTLNKEFASGSKLVVVMDRHSGKVLWLRRAEHNFRHNAIAVAAGKVFCIDKMSDMKLAYLKKHGYENNKKPVLYALDACTGSVIWQTDKGVFGTWLGYSTEHDVLIQTGSRGNDWAEDEVDRGMIAYRGTDGRVLWSKPAEKYRSFGPLMLVGDRIITQNSGGCITTAANANAYSLLTGRLITRIHPLTGETIPWTWVRFKGCGTAIASENLLTFRSASAAFVDLTKGEGTASIGGFRSGCTSNLVIANGVLNAPDYTRTCTCSYQNQASLALVYMPQLEYWTFDYYPSPDKPTPVKRVGINFGAPGNRFADNGTLWLEFPSVGGSSPDIPVRAEYAKPQWFRYHNTRVKGKYNWVTASGIKGLREVSIRMFLQPDKKKPWLVTGFTKHLGQITTWQEDQIKGSLPQSQSYTVRLYFAEVDEKIKIGQRVFDIYLQGKLALKDFDIVKAAGGTNRSVVKEFHGIGVMDDLKFTLAPAAGEKSEPVLCGVEIIAEGCSR